MDFQSTQIIRFVLAFSWIYHGLFPKLIMIAPLEQAMTATIGLSDYHSYLLTKAAGVGEVTFGFILFLFYKNATLLKLNILALISLAVFVAIKMPLLLIEAFNPVTTNFTLIALSYLLLRTTYNTQSSR